MFHVQYFYFNHFHYVCVHSVYHTIPPLFHTQILVCSDSSLVSLLKYRWQHLHMSTISVILARKYHRPCLTIFQEFSFSNRMVGCGELLNKVFLCDEIFYWHKHKLVILLEKWSKALNPCNAGATFIQSTRM